MAGLTTALIMGGAALAGAAVNASATKSAVKTTTQAAEQASSDAMAAALAAGKSQIEAAQIAADAARATAQGNNALLKSIYDQNKMALAPSMATGTGAQDAINAFLGLPVYRQESTPDYEAYVDQNPDILATYEQYKDQFPDKTSFGSWYHSELGDQNPRDLPQTTRQVLDEGAGARQEEAFGKFRDATGYKFALDQSLAAGEQTMAGRGLLKSGKAIKDAQDRAAGLASQSAGQYLNYLSNQQGVGSSAINALTGLSSNFGQQVAANNTNATSTANNALLGATTNANNALLGATSTAGSLGTAAAGTAAQGTLANAGNVSNLLGQAVSAYGQYSGTSSYAKPGQVSAVKTPPFAPDPYNPVDWS